VVIADLPDCSSAGDSLDEATHSASIRLIVSLSYNQPYDTSLRCPDSPGAGSELSDRRHYRAASVREDDACPSAFPGHAYASLEDPDVREFGELLKDRFNRGRPSNLSFWRDRSGHEVDILQEDGGRLSAVEVKSGATVTSDGLRGLRRWQEIAGNASAKCMLVYGGKESQRRGGIEVTPWAALAP
jgi:hypothetical protein